jgi:hypothetical protein
MKAILPSPKYSPLTRLYLAMGEGIPVSSDLIPILGGLLFFCVWVLDDPIVSALGGAAALACLSVYGFKLLSTHVMMGRRQRIPFVAISTAIVFTGAYQASSFAQAVGGGTACTNTGFLSSLGTYASSVLNSGVAVSSVADWVCQMIGIIVLVTILGLVFAILWAGFEVVANQQPPMFIVKPALAVILVLMIVAAVIKLLSGSFTPTAA